MIGQSMVMDSSSQNSKRLPFSIPMKIRQSEYSRKRTEKTTKETKIIRHPNIQAMPAPRVGAITGTRAKTIMTRLITRAISRPEKRSRVNAKAITLGPAAPNP